MGSSIGALTSSGLDMARIGPRWGVESQLGGMSGFKLIVVPRRRSAGWVLGLTTYEQ